MSAPAMETEVSTVSLQSNVYPVVEETPYHDKAFLDAINDPTLLQLFNDRFKGRYYLSELQNRESEYAIHCMHAEKDDFPWGTISTDSGKKVVCKCENFGCQLFTECRSDASVPDLQIPEGAVEIKVASGLATIEEITVPEMEDFNESFYEDLETASVKVGEGQSETRFQTQVPENVEEDEALDFTLDMDEFSWEEEFDQEGSEEEDVAPIVDFEEIDEGGKYAESAPTEEQLCVITMPSDCRTIVNAGPGTGKTFALIEKLKYMLQDQNVPSEKILVLCFSRAAVNVIEDRLSVAVRDGQLTAPWQSLDIRTFDKFATWILYSGDDIGPNSVPEPFLLTAKEIPKLNYEQRIMAAKNLITNWTGLFDKVSHVFVDETQDLVSPRSNLVLSILDSLPEECGFTLLGDSCQAIYDYCLYVHKGSQKVKKGMTSADMIGDLRGSFTLAEFEFTVNHRLKGQLPYSLDSLRAALIAEDTEAARGAVRDVLGLYGDGAEEIRELDRAAIEKVVADGTLGILARTNGEALYISSLLRDKSIGHYLRQADRDGFISRIIADVFVEYESDSIDKQEFVTRAMAVGRGSEDDCADVWRELAEACRGKAMGSRYLVEDLLQCLTSNAKRSTFFTSSSEDSGITVGTIHSAKGREYDTVWLAVDDLAKIAKRGDLDECKVAYVALSRPVQNLKLKRFETASRIMGFVDEATKKQRHFCVPRSAAAGLKRKKRKRVSNIEPIDEIDVDFKSFGNDYSVQEALRKLCKPGSPLSLIKNPAQKGTYPTYKICLESDDGQRPLGLMKPSFAKGFAISLSSINGGKKNGHKAADYIEDCPEAFDDLYVEDVVTCIGSSADAPSSAKCFGSQGVWYGITVIGLAKANSYSY